MSCCCGEFLKQNEKWVRLAQEVLLIRRPIVYAALVITVYSLFGFAYSVEAGFFASVCLVICALYMTACIYAYAGSRLEKLLFGEIPEDPRPSMRIHSVDEILNCPCCKCAGKCPLANKGQLVGILVSLFVAVFFKFVPPFWFNFFVATLVLALPRILAIPQVANALFKTPLEGGAAPKTQAAAAPTPAPEEGKVE